MTLARQPPKGPQVPSSSRRRVSVTGRGAVTSALQTRRPPAPSNGKAAIRYTPRPAACVIAEPRGSSPAGLFAVVTSVPSDVASGNWVTQSVWPEFRLSQLCWEQQCRRWTGQQLLEDAGEVTRQLHRSVRFCAACAAALTGRLAGSEIALAESQMIDGDSGSTRLTQRKRFCAGGARCPCQSVDPWTTPWDLRRCSRRRSGFRRSVSLTRLFWHG